MSPLVTDDDVAAVSEQMRSFWIGRGERVSELESMMAKWVGAKYALAVGSGTAALVVALKQSGNLYADFDDGCCEAVKQAVKIAGKLRDKRGERIAVYPYMDGTIVDFARHLPKRGEIALRGALGVFSFGALKDVSGGLGGCVVWDVPIEDHGMAKLSPLSDINAAMILSQLSRYKGKEHTRLVADNRTWSMAA